MLSELTSSRMEADECYSSLGSQQARREKENQKQRNLYQLIPAALPVGVCFVTLRSVSASTGLWLLCSLKHQYTIQHTFFVWSLDSLRAETDSSHQNLLPFARTPSANWGLYASLSYPLQKLEFSWYTKCCGTAILIEFSFLFLSHFYLYTLIIQSWIGVWRYRNVLH